LGHPSPVENAFYKTVDLFDWDGYFTTTSQHFPLSLEERDGSGNVTNLHERYEIMSYAAEARCNALGAVPNAASMTSSVNLQSLWIYDPLNNHFKAHAWHSGEFRFNNMGEKNYWHTLLDKFGLLSSP